MLLGHCAALSHTTAAEHKGSDGSATLQTDAQTSQGRGRFMWPLQVNISQRLDTHHDSSGRSPHFAQGKADQQGRKALVVLWRQQVAHQHRHSCDGGPCPHTWPSALYCRQDIMQAGGRVAMSTKLAVAGPDGQSEED